jgi:predicted kinase
MDLVQYAVNKENTDVIIDASHLDKWSRRKLTNALDDALARPWEIYYVVMDTPYEECCHRNDNRTGRANVPHDIIKEMKDKMTYPKMSEHHNIKGVWIVRE